MRKYYGAYTVIEYPSGYPRLTLESLEKMEVEAEELLREREYIQACEKYYKIAEEIVKALGEYYAPETMEKVLERIDEEITPWTTRLLNKAVDEILSNIRWEDTEYEGIFRDGWGAAVALHRQGFHDFELTLRDILHKVRKVKGMIALAKDILRNIEGNLERCSDTTGI